MPDYPKQLEEQVKQLDVTNSKYIQPIEHAFFRGQMDQASALHKEAVADVEMEDMPEPLREALGYHLLFYHFKIRWIRNESLWNLQEYQEARRLFEQPALTLLGDLERVRRLLVILTLADHDGLDQLSKQELMALIDCLHGYPDEVVWFYAAGWAFTHGSLEILERAYLEALTDPARWMGQAKWQRINIMYLLVSGRASQRDVEETIKTLVLLPQLTEFEDFIWPKCREAGLVDEELEAMLMAKSQWIRDEKPVPSKPEPRLKHVRRD